MGVRWHRGVSIAEVLIVAIILAVIVAALTTSFFSAELDDHQQGVRHNLQKLRAELDRYQAEHLGRHPAMLNDLTFSSNVDGHVSGSVHTDEAFPIDPYLRSLPENTCSQAAAGARNRVRQIDSHPARRQDLTPGNVGGWLYNPQTGGVWIDHDLYFRI